ncbi:MAG: mandelate racemase/muconate lactonizing protein [Planctomycetes bacterium]|nr:mandelate racemase/muconate lactonizing protein [Planctomycetota bacterium]
MKITRVEALPVRVPLRKGMTTKTAHGEHVDSPYVIVRVHTDEGLVGLGEATVSPRWSGETSRGCVAAIEEILGPALAGLDPTRLNSLRQRLDRSIRLNPFTRAAVEMALWDLAGKASGLPVCRLLGGPVRDSIPIKMVVGAFDVPRAARLAESFLQQGYRCLKVKVGLDPEEDFERVRAVRDLAGPAIPIGIDANGGWDPPAARRMLKKLEPLNLLFAEQPISPGDPRALSSLRASTSIPIMADESVFTLSDAWGLASAQAADILSVYPGKTGGIAASIEMVHVAQAAGLACHLGSNLELGIASAAMIHLASAVQGIQSERYPADLIGPLYHEADLIRRPLDLGPAAARLPDGPGLGVELDEEQLERWSAR